jgi:hypothetical protein
METRPTSGIRYVLDREGEPGKIVYRGAAHMPHASVPLEVRVDAAGAVDVTCDEAEAGAAGADAAQLAKEAAALVRAATKGATSPPRRIARWRAPKAAGG